MSFFSFGGILSVTRDETAPTYYTKEGLPMNKEFLERLSKHELITLLMQWYKTRSSLTMRVNQLEMENTKQREEIRALKVTSHY